MRKHSKRKKSTNGAPSAKSHKKVKKTDSTSHQARHGFLEAFAQLCHPKKWPFICAGTGARRGRKAEVPLMNLLQGLIFHFFNGHGYLSEHLRQLFGLSYSDSAASERRQVLPWEVFARLMRVMLRPLAEKKKHAAAFYRRWRLLAMDGTQFSLSNSPAIKQTAPKSKSRRMRAAFAKLSTVVLLELGLHNPVAAGIGRKGESEWSLAAGLLAQLPKGCLLLADRLYGCAAFISPLLARCGHVQSTFLIRIRKSLKVRIKKRLADGSRLIEVNVRDRKHAHRVVERLPLREIVVLVHRPGFRSHPLRLWTNILDWRQAPALELAKLYAQRWEQELYYRQLKLELRRGERLQSQTIETAAQEIAAWIICSALLAKERARAAGGMVPVLRVSFVKLLELLRPLWLILALGDDLLTSTQKKQLTARFLAEAGRCLSAKRRSRSCPRKVRQPIKGWPRLTRNESWEGPLDIKIVSTKR